MNINANIFFSIIIPVYNTEKYLSGCLDSILNQTFDASTVEVVLINDYSPNEKQCEAIIAMYEKKVRIKYAKFTENKSSHMARKIGVEKSEGKYILFLDPDDFLEINALSLLYEDIQKNGNADYIEFNFYIKRGKYKKINKPKLKGYVGEHTSSAWALDKDYVVWNKCYSSFFLKPLWQTMPNFYSIYNEDFYEVKFTEFYAKNVRIIHTALYIHVYDIGITATKKFDRVKLKKMLLSLQNSDREFCELYRKNGYEDYVSFIHKHSLQLYVNTIYNSNFQDFIDIAEEVLDRNSFKEIVVEYIAFLDEKLFLFNKLKKILSPIKPFLRPFIKFYKSKAKSQL